MTTSSSLRAVRAASCGALVLLLGAAAPAAAQVRAPDAGTILDQNRQPGQPIPIAPPQVLPPSTTTPSAPAPGEEQITVRQIVVEGATRFPAADLQALVADLVGKSVTLAQLRDAAERITRHYQQAGFFLSRAIIPRQDASDGTVHIRVIEATYGKVDANPASGVRLKSSIINGTLQGQGISPGAPVMHDPLERGLLLLSELPGIQATSSLKPGAQAGQSDATVNVSEGPLLSGVVGADNLGNRYTGSNRATAALNVNDPFGWGDIADLRINKSSGTNYLYGAYLVPAGTSGLKLGVNASVLDYKLCCTFATLGARGHATSFAGTVSYPLILTQAQILTASLSGEQRHAVDDSNAGQNADRKINAFTGNLSWLVSDRWGGLNSLSGNLVAGRVDLSSNAANQAFDAVTANTEGTYVKLRSAYTRIQTFAERHQLLLRVSGQWADRNLDSSEKFLAGGYDGVRAYPQGEAPSDMALLGTVEYSYALPVQVPGTLRAGTFIDAAHVQLNRSAWPGFQGTAANLPNSYGLAGIGVGLNWSLPRNFSVNLNIAAKLGSNPGRSATGADADGRNSNVRGWLVLAKYL